MAMILALAGCNRGRVEAARENGTPTVSPAAQDFMTQAAEEDLSALDMARLALRKSANPEVRSYADMTQNEHIAALGDLSELMEDKNVPEPAAASDDARQELSRMSELSGAEFDREFVNAMVADHQKAVEMFRDRIAVASDPDVEKYAMDRLPKLQMQLEKAQRLQSTLFRTSR